MTPEDRKCMVLVGLLVGLALGIMAASGVAGMAIWLAATDQDVVHDEDQVP